MPTLTAEEKAMRLIRIAGAGAVLFGCAIVWRAFVMLQPGNRIGDPDLNVDVYILCLFVPMWLIEGGRAVGWPAAADSRRVLGALITFFCYAIRNYLWKYWPREWIEDEREGPLQVMANWRTFETICIYLPLICLIVHYALCRRLRSRPALSETQRAMFARPISVWICMAISLYTLFLTVLLV